jgi:hypothetical protein
MKRAHETSGAPITARKALAFVRKHGLVLQSAHVRAVPVLVDYIAGSTIRGSWWGHSMGKQIFEVLNDVHDSGDVVALRLIEGKLTLAHRSAWPALVALAGELGRARLAAVRESHTPSGKHETTSIPFPEWVPRDVLAQARTIDIDKARSICAAALT